MITCGILRVWFGICAGHGQLFPSPANLRFLLTTARFHATHDLMLNCRACLWRCIQALDVPTTNAHRLRRNVNPFLANSQQRLLSARNVARQEGKTPTDLSEARGRSRNREDHFKKSAFAAKQKRTEILALRQSHALRVEETPNLAKLGRRDPRMSESDWNRRKRELRHLQDPLDLAAFVKQELDKDRVEEMLQLVRMASHSMQCIVSWNHIIDHLLAKERVKDALKVYNDVRLVNMSSVGQC